MHLTPAPATQPRFAIPGPAIPVVIVTFRNATDLRRCLRALSRLSPEPAFAVFICENGGPAAFDEQVAVLTAPDGICDPDDEPLAVPTIAAPRLSRIVRLRLRREAGAPPVTVQMGQSTENLGYAGGVNTFLGPLLEDPGWPGAWVLNPDTEPGPDALRELASYASQQDRCMVGSRLVTSYDESFVQMRGLAWRKWRGATGAVDRLGPVVPDQPVDLVEGRIDAPSGASLYVTHAGILHIGLMYERFFLYFEDLEWGMRARRRSPIGYAYHSIVVHEGGTTTGSRSSRRGQSALTTYLDCRNRLLFVRQHFGWWLAWMAMIEVLEIVDHARRREFASMRAAMRGLAAGLRGTNGRPDSMLRSHSPVADGGGGAPLPGPGHPRDRVPLKGKVKVAIGLGAHAVGVLRRAIGRTVGLPPPPVLTILYYHSVADCCAPGFARQMRQLARWARVVGADWTGDGAADRRPLVAITFDDAFESVLVNALPILAEHGFPCTIFVPTGHVGHVPSWLMDAGVVVGDRVASAERLSRLDPGLVTLGSHTVTHPHLSTLPDEVIRRELVQSRQDIAALTGSVPTLFAFPYGARSDRAEAICRDLGFERVFTIEPTTVILADDAFTRGRVAVEPGDGPLEFYLKATGCYVWMAAASAGKRALRRLLGRPAHDFAMIRPDGSESPDPQHASRHEAPLV